MKHTKNKLLSSIATLIVCFAMLIGSTYAWFTDSASTGVNRIQAGNLDIELYHSSTGDPDEKVTGSTLLFQIDKWEPGVFVYENLSIRNEGNLALKYTLDFYLQNVARNYVVEKVGNVVTGTTRSLADVLYVSIDNGIFTGSRPSLTSSDGVLLSSFLTTGNNSLDSGALEVGGVKNISVIIYWPESNIDNGYNLKNGWYSTATSGDTTDDNLNGLYIDLPIELSATQYTSEYDSFGKDYDKVPGQLAPFVKPVSTSSAPVNTTSQTELNTDKGSVIIPEDSNLPPNTVAHLEINPVTTSNGNLTVSDDNTVVSYEVELLDQNGNKISLESNTEKTLTARVEVGYGLDVSRIQVYRDGTTQLTIIKYEDGYVYFESDHFCDVDVVLPDVIAKIGNTYYYDYYELVQNVSSGALIEGIKDLDQMKTTIESEYPDKYVIVTDTENRTITLSAAVAKIGNTVYNTLSEAFEEAVNDDVISLVDDATSNSIKLNGKNVTLDLSGYKLNLNGNDGFTVKNATLTLKDSSETETGVINHVGTDDLAWAQTNGKVCILSGTYLTNGSYGILCGSQSQSGITGGKFNTSHVTCPTGYEVVEYDGWYIPQRYYMWTDVAATEYTAKDEANKTLAIGTAEELALFAKEVNSGINYSKWTVSLTNDIDLAGKRWTPIGKSGKPFQGYFDGQSFTISNLEINTPSTSDVGLFGLTQNGSIKNLNVNNAKINGYLDVGVVAGTPYTSSYSNITVTGDIYVNGYAYVGGMFGKNLYANADTLTLMANDGSYVSADSEYYRTYVGGIVGFMGEGNQKVSNVISNINVYGSTCDVGGITGIAHYNNTFENCSTSGNVYITSYNDDGDQLEIGGIAGVWHNENGTKVTFNNCSFTGTVSAIHSSGTAYEGEFKYGGLIGRPYSTAGTGQLLINGVVQE